LEEDDGGVTRLDAGWVLFSGLTGTSVDLGTELRELASNVSGVAIQDWCVAGTDLTGVVEDHDLGEETFGILAGVVLGVRADITSLDILDGQVLDVETNVVTRGGFINLFVVHFDGLDFSGGTDGSESDDHTGLDDTSLNTTNGYCSDTADLVDVLEGKTEGLVSGSLGWGDFIKSVEEALTLVPRHLVRLLDHVITVPAGDGDELNLGGVVADLLEVGSEFTNDFVVSLLLPVDGGIVHLVAADNHLGDTHSLGEESVFTGLTVSGETGFETTSFRGNHEDGSISLGGTSDHVLDEISVTGGINDGVDSLGRLELPEGNINGDTTFTFGLELIQNPSVLEGTLTHFVSFLLELLDGTSINTTALVDQVTSGGGLAGIDVTDNDQVKSVFFFLFLSDFFLCDINIKFLSFMSQNVEI